MKLRFLETVQYETLGRHKGPVFEAGETYDFPDSIAERWLRRGVAEVVGSKRAPRKILSLKPEEGPNLEQPPEE